MFTFGRAQLVTSSWQKRYMSTKTSQKKVCTNFEIKTLSRFDSSKCFTLSDVDFAFPWRDVIVKDGCWLTDEYDIYEVLGR